MVNRSDVPAADDAKSVYRSIDKNCDGAGLSLGFIFITGFFLPHCFTSITVFSFALLLAIK